MSAVTLKAEHGCYSDYCADNRRGGKSYCGGRGGESSCLRRFISAPILSVNSSRGGGHHGSKYISIPEFRIVDQTHLPLNLVLPLRHYLPPIEFIASSPGCMLFSQSEVVHFVQSVGSSNLPHQN